MDNWWDRERERENSEKKEKLKCEERKGDPKKRLWWITDAVGLRERGGILKRKRN